MDGWTRDERDAHGPTQGAPGRARALAAASAALVALLAAVALLCILAPHPGWGAQAATLVVPDDYATIQKAIDAARPGDTVRVYAGTYNGSV